MGLFQDLRKAEVKPVRTPVKESTQTPAVAPSPEKSKIDYLTFGEKKTKKGYVCPDCGTFLDEGVEFNGCPKCGHQELRETTLMLEGGEMVSGPDVPDEPQTFDDAVNGLLSAFQDRGFDTGLSEDGIMTLAKDGKVVAELRLSQSNVNGINVIVSTCMKSGYSEVGSLESEDEAAYWIDKVVDGTAKAIETSTEEVQPSAEEKPVEEVHAAEVPAGEGEVQPTAGEGEVQPTAGEGEVQPTAGEGAPASETPAEGTPSTQGGEQISVTTPLEGSEEENNEPENPPEDNLVRYICPECNGEYGMSKVVVRGNELYCPDCGALIDSTEVTGEDKVEVVDPASASEEQPTA